MTICLLSFATCATAGQEEVVRVSGPKRTTVEASAEGRKIQRHFVGEYLVRETVYENGLRRYETKYAEEYPRGWLLRQKMEDPGKGIRWWKSWSKKWFEAGGKQFEDRCERGRLVSTVEWYQNGAVKRVFNEGDLRNTDCMLSAFEYYPSGAPKSRIYCKRGIGKMREVGWYESGKMSYEREFGKPHYGGKLRTYQIEWYENGQQSCEARWDPAGKQTKWVAWWPNGKLKLEVKYRDGEQIAKQRYDEDGNPTE